MQGLYRGRRGNLGGERETADSVNRGGCSWIQRQADDLSAWTAQLEIVDESTLNGLITEVAAGVWRKEEDPCA
jgi:hypothetical protein